MARIVLPEKIIEKVKKKCDPAWDEIRPPIKKLRIELNKIVKKKKKLLQEKTGLKYEKPDYPSEKAVRDSLKRVQKEGENIGAGSHLRNLLCFYAFEEKSWTDTLKELKLDESIIIEESIKIKSSKTLAKTAAIDIATDEQQEKKEELFPFHNIKSFIEKEFFVTEKSGEIIKDKVPNSEIYIEFNSPIKSRLKDYESESIKTSRIYYSENEKTYVGYIHEYDQKNNTVEKTYFKSSGEILFKNIINFDEIGNEIKKITYLEKTKYSQPQTIIHEYKIKYNEKKNISERIECVYYRLSKKKNFFKKIFIENSNENYFSELNRNTYDYDDKGNLIEEIQHSPNREFTRYVYKYDINNNCIEEIVYIGKNIIWIDKMKYDIKGNRVESIKFDKNNNERGEFHTYKYDEYCNLIELTWYVNKTIWHHVLRKYHYDSYGNWIRMNLYEFGKLIIIREREIIYEKGKLINS